MKFYLTLFYLFTITTSIFSQGSFTKEIISEGHFRTVKITDDGGWLIGGRSDEILKFNSCGDLEWNKKLEFQDRNLSDTRLDVDLEGNILLLAVSRFDTISSWKNILSLTKLDKDGEFIWCKTFEIDNLPFYSNSFHNLEITSEGKYLISALIDPLSNSGDRFQFITKINTDG